MIIASRQNKQLLYYQQDNCEDSRDSMTGTSIYILVIILTMLNVRHAQECIVSPPCKCTTRLYANCSNLNLIEIPKLRQSPAVWVLDLNNNLIKSIGPNVTMGVQLSQVYLSNNIIEEIDDRAFTGSEMSLDEIHLDGNHLTQIPGLVTMLPELISIQIHNNPIEELDKEILSKISDTLIGLTFGSSSMTSWPVHLQELTNLAILKVYDLPFDFIPDNGFQGFDENLGSFDVINTSLKLFPTSIDKLNKLTHLGLAYNSNLTKLPETAFVNLPELTNLFLTNNGFTSIPAIFDDLTNIYQMAISSPELEYIEKAQFPTCNQRRFTYLSITNTKLSSVPDAIRGLKTLTSLDLSNGRITHIRNEDFNNMSSIVSILLSGNPIRSVDSGAFVNLSTLLYLYLDRTDLTTVPEAIKYTDVLSVDMTKNDIRCTCSNLGWMINWKRRTETKIDGQCSIIAYTINYYKDVEIPKC